MCDSHTISRYKDTDIFQQLDRCIKCKKYCQIIPVPGIPKWCFITFQI